MTKRQNRYTKLLNLDMSKSKQLESDLTAQIELNDRFQYLDETAARQAGIYTPQDMVQVEKQYQQMLKMRGITRLPQQLGPRETLSNTTRFRQAPGTSAIYGGRRKTKEQTVDE